MTVDYEQAPRPAPLWALPLAIAALALALLWIVHNYFGDTEVEGFGGRAQPTTPRPEALADGTPPPETPEPLVHLFGDDVVMTSRINEVPPEVEENCRGHLEGTNNPAREQLREVIESSAPAAGHLGPDALTQVSVAIADAPPGYPNEVAIACVARRGDEGWDVPTAPYIDFALDGRPGARMAEPDLRTRLVQVPVGARWAVQPRGGWWLAYDVRESSWVLLTLGDAITDNDPLRVTFVDATGEVVADSPVGPTRSAAEADHSADLELVAGDVPIVLERIENRPIRICDPTEVTLCVWLGYDEQREVVAYAGFGPHPLDTPPMGYVGYCPPAKQMQGSLTSSRFHTDGTWAGGPVDRGLDRYTVRYEANQVVVDLSEQVRGDPQDGDAVEQDPACVFNGRARGEVPEDDEDDGGGGGGGNGDDEDGGDSDSGDGEDEDDDD